VPDPGGFDESLHVAMLVGNRNESSAERVRVAGPRRAEQMIDLIPAQDAKFDRVYEVAGE